MARSDIDASDFMPSSLTLTSLREAVQGCRGCSLYENASQAVFGEGLERAHLMLVGEQPGDAEDRAGRPFVGPAGRLLDQALEQAGIPRDEAFVTNAVKHFKFEPRGKRRIHKKPTHYELRACRPWFEAELAVVEPDLLVLLGATAAQSVLGPKFRVTQHRGEPIESRYARWTFATVHPASVLRAPDDQARREARSSFFDDFRIIADCYRQAVRNAA